MDHDLCIWIIHIQMPPVAAPVTWNTEGTSGSFSSEILDGTQGMQHLVGEMQFPEGAKYGRNHTYRGELCFNDLFNKGTNNETTAEEIAANAAQEYWKIDTEGYGLMGTGSTMRKQTTTFLCCTRSRPCIKPVPLGK